MVRYRNTWAQIDLGAIRHNVERLNRLLPEGRRIMGVVKADGYGHGSVEVAKTLIASGIDHLMVAYLEEAITLREHGIELPILVIGRIPPKYVNVAVRHQITLAVFQPEWIEEALKQEIDGTLEIHVEFETGFNRTGIRSVEALRELVNAVKRSNNKIKITGAYTHFATADEIDSPHYNRQKKQYEKMLHELEQLYDRRIITHIGNSAAGIQYPKQMRQYTRFGISLYGLYPSSQIKALRQVDLQEAFSLHSELIEVKRIEPGEYIGYGITYKAKKEEWIGTVPIGYADGWPRALQGFHVLIDGKRHEIVGRICMDMLMVKLDQPYPVGEKVTLIGKNKGEKITVDDIATYLNTINYEVPCMITSRVPREYINKEVKKTS
ncbi:MAG TPA: alanine racemase [Pseudogracilibacillus sp.]|mgnify:CR=1 FL=1|nr:alanine racemase [Pseudogracilibacillus sp.]